MKPRLCALSTRAYENMVGVAMANPNGENAGNTYRKVKAYDLLLGKKIEYPFIRDNQGDMN